MSKWLTVDEAVQQLHRHGIHKEQSTIYRWIRTAKIQTLQRTDNIALVNFEQVLHTAQTLRPGRKQGSASISKTTLDTLKQLLNTPIKHVK